MRNTKSTLAVAIAVLFTMNNCSNNSSESGFKYGEESEIIAEETQAVCIWEGTALRQGPSRSSKYMSSVSLGEKILLLSQVVVDTNDPKKREFFKARLSDGSEGWVQAWLVVENARPGAITQKISIFKRPDLLTGTDKSFEVMDMVAVAVEKEGSEKEGWIEVVGNKKKKKGWIKNENITYEDIDIAVAILANKALVLKDQGEKITKIEEILKNGALNGSTFIGKLRNIVEELIVEINVEEVDEDDQEEYYDGPEEDYEEGE